MRKLIYLLQILESWRSKRVLDTQKVDEVMAILDQRRQSIDASAEGDTDTGGAVIIVRCGTQHAVDLFFRRRGRHSIGQEVQLAFLRDPLLRFPI